MALLIGSVSSAFFQANSIRSPTTIANLGTPSESPNSGGLQAKISGSKSPKMGDLGGRSRRQRSKKLIELTFLGLTHLDQNIGGLSHSVGHDAWLKPPMFA